MNNIDKLISFLDNLGIRYETDTLIRNYITFRVGGPCRLMCFPDSQDKIVNLVNYLKQNSNDYYIIGKGSNLIAPDSGYDGIIINTCEYDSFAVTGNNIITCSAGTSLMKLCRFALDNSLSGLEFAYGIPGTVGGAVYMNAGAYGGEMKDVLTGVSYIDDEGVLRTARQDELDLGYRHSMFSGRSFFILSAELTLAEADKSSIKEKMDDLLERRRSKQPLEYPSAGSTFKRPEGYYAGALIEECGLKGFSVGGAQVSEKHAGFVINKDNATASDIIELIRQCQQNVKDKKGVSLETEVKYIGQEE